VTVVRVLALAAAAATAAMACAAYRRSERTGEPLGESVQDVAREWSCSRVSERARRAAREGRMAAALREEAADADIAAAGTSV
jgi:hypothetical protein